MNKIIKGLVLGLMFVALLSSCEKNKPTKYDGPSLASFNDVSERSFYVQDIAKPVDTIKVSVTTATNAERKVKFQIVTDGIDTEKEANAVEGTHFTLLTPEAIIPANKTVGYIIVEGKYSALSTYYAAADAKDLQLVLDLVDGGDVTAAKFDSRIKFSLFDYVPFVPADWEKTHNVTIFDMFTGAPVANTTFAMTIKDAAAKSFTTGAFPGTQTDLTTAGVTEIIYTVDISNPSRFTIRFNDIPLGDHSKYGPMVLRTYPDKNVVNTKKKLIQLRYSKSVSAGSFYYYLMQIINS